MTAAGEDDDIVLKLLHTADWHLGRRFRSFSANDEKKLMRARLDVLDRILLSAERNAVDAVLCAGDLFDDPHPIQEWWEQVAGCFKKRAWKTRPVFMLPGNHDPLLADSVWRKPSFRSMLPEWVHVVDRDDFEYSLPSNAVLYAVPCNSKAGQRDPTGAIPKREPGDERIRIGMVHGSTFDATEYETNFPIAVDAAITRGLDYLAIGDTHGFRFVPENRLHPPTIYPGAPEATAFDEKGPGSVAVVLFDRKGKATVKPERVAHWTWEESHITTLDQLNQLARRGDLGARVMRLRVEMKLSAPEYEQAEAILQSLVGTDARHGKVGILTLEREDLELDASDVDAHCGDLPEVLLSVVRRLQSDSKDPTKAPTAQRALVHLYRASRRRVS